MSPKLKADTNLVILDYMKRKKLREKEGRSKRGLNTEVGKMFGLTGQRVGQIIMAYEAEPVEIHPPPDRPPDEPSGACSWAIKQLQKETRKLGDVIKRLEVQLATLERVTKEGNKHQEGNNKG